MAVTADLLQLFRPAGWRVIVPDALGAVLEHAMRLAQRVSVALIWPRDGCVCVGPVGDDEDLAPAKERLVAATSNDQITREWGIDAHGTSSILRLS